MQCIELKEFYQNLHPCFQCVEIFVIVLVLGQILALLLEYARAGAPELLEEKKPGVGVTWKKVRSRIR